jgi:hypothetical protein
MWNTIPVRAVVQAVRRTLRIAERAVWALWWFAMTQAWIAE